VQFELTRRWSRHSLDEYGCRHHRVAHWVAGLVVLEASAGAAPTMPPDPLQLQQRVFRGELRCTRVRCARIDALDAAEVRVVATFLLRSRGVVAILVIGRQCEPSSELLPHKEAIEQHLVKRFGELFDLDYELLLYDVTTTCFEGQCADPSIARRASPCAIAPCAYCR
jgi:hypothetical protein